MTMVIEEAVAKLRKAKNEDDLFYKIRAFEKEYVAEIDEAEKGKKEKAIENSIDKLMTFYHEVLKIATLDATRDRIAACIHFWESRAFRMNIELKPIDSFPLPLDPLRSQAIEPITEKVDTTNLGSRIGLPSEIITAVQNSMTDFRIEYAEYVFLDEGILTIVYTKIKEAINSSTTEDECIINLSNVVNTYSTLKPLELFLEQQEKREKKIYKIFQEGNPMELESLLRESRACVPHYEITISALDLALAAILAGFLENRFLSVVASKVTSLLFERKIREEFFESKVKLFKDEKKSPAECKNEFFDIMKKYLKDISEIRDRSAIDVSAECKRWIKKISNELKEQGRLSQGAIKMLREQLDINLKNI